MPIPTSEEERSPDAARDRLRILVRAAADKFVEQVLAGTSTLETDSILLRNECEDAARDFQDLIR